MRPRVAVPLILLALAVLLLPLLRLKPFAGGHASASAPLAAPSPAPLARNRPAKNGPKSPADTNEAGDTGYEKYVSDRIDQLGNLAMTGDSNALTEIESELDSRDPQIQAAAVEAVIQFGSRAAIPALEAAARHLDDSGQKAGIQRAIDFLELPTQSEASEAVAANAPAERN